jgi:beta-galactosidase
VGAELQRLAPEVADTHIKAQVAILMDWQNWWAVEYQPGPSNRLRYWEQIGAGYRPFHKLNVAVDTIAPDSDLSQYRLVIAPLLYMLRPGVAQHLQQFVERGGILLTTFFSGIVDQYARVVPGGYPSELRKLLGIYVEEFDPWTPEMSNELVVKEGALSGTYPCTLWGELVRAEGAQVLGTFAHDYYADQPALTVNRAGNGQAYYIATQGNDELLDKLAAHLYHEAGIEPVLESPDGVEITKRVRSDGRAIYFLLNYNEQPCKVALPGGTFRSLLDGRDVQGEVEIEAGGVVVLGE